MYVVHVKLESQHRLPLIHVHTKALIIFEIIHVDLWDPALLNPVDNRRYFVLFVDDFNIF